MIHGVKAGDRRWTTAANSQKGEFKVFSCANTQTLKMLRAPSSLNVHVDWRVCITPECERASVNLSFLSI